MTAILNVDETKIEKVIVDTLNKVMCANREWMTLKEGAEYANVSYNTFAKFRLMGLKICEIDGVKRVSRREIDQFLQDHSF